MSRTDKTDPYWVKAERYGTIDHDHSDGICNIGDDRKEWVRNACGKGLYYAYWDMGGPYYPNPGRIHAVANELERSERRRIKNVLRNKDWNNEVLDYKPRNSAKWICW